MKDTTTKLKILIVEDDTNLGMILVDYLEMMGYKVDLAVDGVQGMNRFRADQYSLVILDVMMPRKDGFTLAKEIRQYDMKTPIVFVTAKNQKEDRIKGFQIGCDDYITKPFSTEELSLRIQAILKRCQTDQDEAYKRPVGKVQLGAYEFDLQNMILKKGKHEQSLTRKEAALLSLLYKHQNEVLPRELALEKIWGENNYFIGRSMDVFISRLRKHLKDDPGVKITNVHGIGFKLELPG
jgi:DNA-binding response OmpR family regulator